jgi:hypothetical protein
MSERYSRFETYQITHSLKLAGGRNGCTLEGFKRLKGMMLLEGLSNNGFIKIVRNKRVHLTEMGMRYLRDLTPPKDNEKEVDYAAVQ